MSAKKNPIKLIIIVCILAIMIFGLVKSGALEYLKDREKLEILIKSLGAWGPIAYIGLYAVVTTTCISVLPLTLVGGLIFGAVMGIVYTAIGACLGLSLAFLIARYIARKPIEEKFGKTEAFKKINEGVKNDGWFILATTRLLPVFPFGIQNYVYGLTPISFIQYSLLSTIFILPGTSVFVLLAGAVASGDMKTAAKMSIVASLIFFGLTIITKLIAKKAKKNS
ncbi:MAG: TVP38/TMEM64 family protein [Cetobacterium sp.]|uniref:TVP38/TMEM64 family protein n=1 Tax=Cetobacterium sp. TaxID=2071632 RepID=UPI003F36F13B